MPYPNFHAARVKEPRNFVDGSLRTKKVPGTVGITMIVGRPWSGKGGMTVQAYRFAKEFFTADQAKKWLEDHKVVYLYFEKASE
jgi:hypothetical protein